MRYLATWKRICLANFILSSIMREQNLRKQQYLMQCHFRKKVTIFASNSLDPGFENFSKMISLMFGLKV